MENVATPAVPSSGTPPVAPAATPTPATPVAVPQPEMVTLTKEAHDQLARDAARAGTNQSKADRYDRIVGKKGGHFGVPAAPAAAPSVEDAAAAASAEDRKAERGLMQLAADPALREVLDADPTLRTLLTSNPLAVLPMYANDALDADDAVALVKEALLKKAKPATPTAPPAMPPTHPTPPPGGVNPPDGLVNEEVEQARKNPNTERAVAGMISAKLKGGKK